MDTRRPLFHYRPMAALALGVCAGIILYDILKGTWLFIAMCLLLCIFALCMKLGRNGWAVFAAAAALGAVRCLFPPFELPIGIMAPFQHTRNVLTRVTASLFEEQGPILQAMLWGHKGDIPSDTYAAYRMSGIAHVLALSGLHVSFVAALIDRLTARRPIKPKFIITAGLLFSYCAVAAFPASLIRAAVMTLCALYARVCGRRYDMLSAMSFAAAIILAADPSALFEIGFQLSFGAVFSIALLMGPISEKLSFLPDDIASLLAVSICGTLGTLPLCAYHFGTIPVLGLFANMLILPIVPFVFVSALLISLLGLALPGLAGLLAPAAEFFTAAMTSAAEAVSSVSFAVRSADISPLSCLFIYLGYLCLSDYPLLSPQKKYAACAAMFAGAVLCMV
ncbi:MAG: ComEC/Rec2 family competence protein [Clostridia bacterium]|nr:ComEC/Rec2 family competence protein [Clostridia bacterium]